VYSRDTGRGNSREGGGRALTLTCSGPASGVSRPAAASHARCRGRTARGGPTARTPLRGLARAGPRGVGSEAPPRARRQAHERGGGRKDALGGRVAGDSAATASGTGLSSPGAPLEPLPDARRALGVESGRRAAPREVRQQP
jgi:hypothetical protein